ncbi:MAG: diaminopimelate epimerase [Alphaproteobacteria bacterium]
MIIPFLKMHGLGNDFVIVDKTKNIIPDDKQLIVQMSDRHTGIGCDQFIVLDTSETADVFMHIYNWDGSVAGACGNATRCVASLYMDNKDTCKIETISGILDCEKIGNDIRVNMGMAKTNWNEIPLANETDASKLEIAGFTGFCVNMGNPHIVITVDDAEKVDLAKFGSQIENDPIFPDKVNVEFISKTADGVRMRVWERGGMITKACGSGACAVFVACNKQGICGNELLVHLDGGDLTLSYNESQEVLMCGGFTTSFSGDFNYE